MAAIVVARTRPTQPLKRGAEHPSSVHRKCGNEVEQTEDQVHEHEAPKKCSKRRVGFHPANSQELQAQQPADDGEIHGWTSQGDQQLGPGALGIRCNRATPPIG